MRDNRIYRYILYMVTKLLSKIIRILKVSIIRELGMQRLYLTFCDISHVIVR